ncbi:MAG: FkbM family methyltransferase [Flavitalea sp.]
MLFCIKICADISSLTKLISNSKKYDRYQRETDHSKNKQASSFKQDPAVIYRLKTDQVRTVHMRTFSGDLQMFYEVFFENAYAIAPAENKHPLTIIDAGSNIGLSALFFLSEYEIAKMICIEPDPANLKLLQRNLADEIASRKVKIIDAALCNNEGSAPWHQSSRSYNSRMESEKNSNIRVRTISLNTMIKSENIHSIDLIKMDIEGAERYVFEDDISWLNITRNFVIEIHRDEEIKTIPETLQRIGFTVTKLDSLYSTVFFATRN